LVVGCATAYQPDKGTGGYSDARLDDNTFVVQYRVRGGDIFRARTFMLRRCAELTVQAGFDWFVVVDSEGSVIQVRHSVPGSVTSTTDCDDVCPSKRFGGGSVKTDTNTPAQTYNLPEWATTKVMIKAFLGQPPADDTVVVNAHALLEYAEPKE
jgi:hypothetical protein